MKMGPSLRRTLVNAAGKRLTPNRLRHLLNG